MLNLTPREKRVLDTLASGFSEKVAADYLEITIKNLRDATYHARKRNGIQTTSRLLFVYRVQKAGYVDVCH